MATLDYGSSCIGWRFVRGMNSTIRSESGVRDVGQATTRSKHVEVVILF